MPYEEMYYLRQRVKKIQIRGLLLRICILLLVLVFSNKISPSYVMDDIMFEKFAINYQNYAAKIIDLNAFKIVSIANGGVSASFLWFWIVSIIQYCTHQTWTIRLFNIVISICNISLTARILSKYGNSKLAIKAAQWMAYFPILVIPCCFLIKDILVMFLFLQALNYVADIRNRSETLVTTVKMILSLIGIYFLRSGLTELLIVIIVIAIVIRVKNSKNYLLLFFLSILILVSSLFFIREISTILSSKVTDYMGYGRTSDSAISFIRVDSITDIYKLPFSYAFALIQPLDLTFNVESWGDITSLLNVSILPVAVMNILYLFSKKKADQYMYVSTLALYCGTIVLSLGITRHYYYLLPVEVINGVYMTERLDMRHKGFVVLASIIVALMYAAVQNF